MKPVQGDLEARVTELERENALLRAARGSEEMLDAQHTYASTVLSNTPDFAYAIDLQGRFTYANAALLSLWQKRLEDVKGKTFFELGYPPELAERLHLQIRQVVQTRQRLCDRTPFTNLSGDIRTYEYIFVPILSAQGTVEGVAGSTRDITELARAEEVVHDDRRRWRELLVQTPAAIAILRGPQHRFEWVNADYARLIGRSSESMLGRTLLELFPEIQSQVDIDLLNKVYATGDPYVGHEAPAHVTRDGVLHDLYLNFAYMPTRDLAGEIDGVFAHVIDVTDMVRARMRAEESEARFRAAVQANSSVLWTNNARGEMEGEQPGWAGLTGQSQEQYQGYGWSTAVHPDDAAATVDAWNKAVAARSLFVFEHRVRRHDGEWRLFSIRAVPVLEPNGDIREWVGVHNDIMDERSLLNALQQSEKLFRQALDSMPQLVWSALPDGRLDLYNEQWHAYTGLSPDESQREGWKVAVHPDDRPRVWELWLHSLRTGDTYETEYRCRRFDGECRWFLGRAVPIRDEAAQIVRWFGTCTDIEDRKKAEHAVLSKQKLESLGLLAGGIAHDFNNLLVGVLGGASHAVESLPETHPLQPVLEGIVTAGERAAHLTRQMLAYAGKGRFVIEPVNMSALARSTCELIRASIPKHVQLTLDTPPALPTVEADPGQMQQIVMNLILNAVEAVDPGRAGIVSVRTKVEHLDATHIAGMDLVSGGLVPGLYLMFEVRDNGSGMDRETKAKMFDPFFTTKFTGRGLGLSAVHGIVRSHHAALSLDSQVGKGSTFRVYLPASHAAASEGPPSLAAANRSAGAVLVVDDEAIVRNTAQAALKRAGFRVVLAENGGEALQKLADTPSIELVLLDMTMPEMDGKDVMRQIRARGLTVPVLICSGYSEAEVYREFSGFDIAGFLQKPFTSQQLRAKIDHVLPPAARIHVD